MTKKRKTVTVPKVYDPPGKAPPETLAYLSPAEHEMIRRMTDGTASRGPKSVPSYADDSASSMGVSRPATTTRTNYNSGTGGTSSTTRASVSTGVVGQRNGYGGGGAGTTRPANLQRSYASTVLSPAMQRADRRNTLYSPSALGSLYRNVGTYGIANRDLKSLAQQQLLGQTIAASQYGGRVTANLNPKLTGNGTVNPFRDDVATHWTGGNKPLGDISGNGYAVTIDKNGNVNYTRAFNSDGTIRSTNHMMGLNRGYVGISSHGVEPNSAQLSAASALGQNWFNPGANVSTHGYEAGTRVVRGERSVPPKNRRQEREGVALASAFTGTQDPGKRWSPTQIASVPSSVPVTNSMTPPPVRTAAVHAPVPITPPPPLPAKKPPASPPDPADLPTPPGYFAQFAMTPSDIETLKQQAMKDYPAFSFDPWKVTQATMGANIGALPGFMGPITRDQRAVAAAASQTPTRVAAGTLTQPYNVPPAGLRIAAGTYTSPYNLAAASAPQPRVAQAETAPSIWEGDKLTKADVQMPPAAPAPKPVMARSAFNRPEGSGGGSAFEPPRPSSDPVADATSLDQLVALQSRMQAAGASPEELAFVAQLISQKRSA